MSLNIAHILLIALAVVAAGCNSGVELDVTQNAALTSVDQTPLDTDLLCSDISYENEAGKTITGTRDCSKAKAACKNVGDTDCYIGDDSLYGMDPKDLKAENIKVGVEVGGVTGTYVTKDDFCTAEGQSNCVATAAFPAALVSDIKAKVVQGQTVGSHAGEMVPDLPDAANVASGHTTGGVGGSFALCGGGTTTNCVVTGAQQTATPGTIVAGDIKKGEIIDGVTGTFETTSPNCAANGAASCVARSGYVALERSRLVNTNLETGYALLAVTGNVTARPGPCSADGSTSCVAGSRFAAIDKSTLSPSILRTGVTLGGVVGAYPSAAFPLAGAQNSVTDLDQTSFNTAIKTAAPFEFFSSAGQRFQVTGSNAITGANILTSKNLFGVAGALTATPAPCTAGNVLGCVTQASFPAIEKSRLSAATIRKGVIIAGVHGDYPSAAHPLSGKGASTELDFPANLSGGHNLVFWDAAGNAHTVAADSDLAATNILSGVTIFGQLGSATASPAACSGHNELGCVASNSRPSYALSSVNTKVLKKGVTFTTTSGTLTGVFPSASAPLEPISGVTRLTPPDFNGVLSSTDAFEFWDSTGQKHTAHGDAAFTAASFKTGVNLFGVTGSADPRPSDCTGSALGCVTTAGRPSYDKNVIVPAVIKNGVTIGNITGSYPSAATPLAGASGAIDLQAGTFAALLAGTSTFEYFNSAGSRFTAQGDADLAEAANIRQGTEIFGRTGSQAESPSLCTAEMQTGCVIAGANRSLDATKVSANIFKHGESLLGVTGNYPSNGNRLDGASAMADLTAGNWQGNLRSAGNFEFWDATGTRRTGTGSASLTAGNLKDGTSLYGVTGTLETTTGDCTASGDVGCTALAAFPSYQKSALTSAVLKNGVTVLGVTGGYPSSSHPLAAGGDPRLASDFNGAMQSNSNFTFWDQTGQRYVGSGDSDLTAANIRKDTVIFGVTGTTVPAPELDPWDVVFGVNYTDAQGAARTGMLKLNCANMHDSSVSLEGPLAMSNPKYHTTDDFNNGRNRMPNTSRFGTDTSYVCNGDAFEDISYHNVNHSQVACDPGNANVTCIFKDRIADLEWLQLDTAGEGRKTHSQAVTKCANKTAGGHSDWRLPTQKEALMAYVHGIRKISLLGGTDNIFRIVSFTWTNTVNSSNSGQAYMVEMAQGLNTPTNKGSSTAYAHCVRQSRQFP